MSTTRIEQASYTETPADLAGTPDGIPVLSVTTYAEETYFADLFTGEPGLARQLWIDARSQMLESDFDPRQAYLDGFALGVAARESRELPDKPCDVAFAIPRQPNGDTEPFPTEPNSDVLMQLGSTSLFLEEARAYYQNTRQS